MPLVFWPFGIFVSIVTFLFIGVSLNIAQILNFVLIFLYHFGGFDFNGWITCSTTFLVAFIFLRGLSLDRGLSLR